MLLNRHILNILHESAELLQVPLDSKTLEWVDNRIRKYGKDQLKEFIQDLTEAGSKNSLVYLQKDINDETFGLFLENFDSPVLTFIVKDDLILPVLIGQKHGSKKTAIVIKDLGNTEQKLDDLNIKQLFRNKDGEIITISIFTYDSVAGTSNDELDKNVNLTPMKRLIRLLKTEKKDIFYIYIYAVIIGVSSLILPLGIQAAIELISGGVFFSSIYFLIGFIIIGVIGAGILQVFQITIVEYLQRRVFTKAAFEFAYRVPRIKMEAVMNLHFPELINRFFDVLTIQKGLPKLLIDLSTAAIQILFGLILLSFYHPFFVFFGLLLIATLFIIFYTTGPKGLESSIVESKYKYKAVYWLEEMARALYSFKLSGTTTLPIRKTDYFVNNYLKNRKKHFSILISQYAYILLFKAVVTAGLLIMGTILVVRREITLGQFVASEVIIILILNSVEKIISYIDVVYDMLTAVDKIAHVTDLPLEKTGGVDVPLQNPKFAKGLQIKVANLSYTYPNSKKPSIHGIDLEIKSGERVCISGMGSSGKTTLTSTLAGIYSDFDGSITINDNSIRDLDRIHLRDLVGKNVSIEDIFEGTLQENIMVGKPSSEMESVLIAMEKSGLNKSVNKMKDGLNTPIVSGGKGFSETFLQRVILARCLAKNPKLLILNDFFGNFPKSDRIELLNMLVSQENNWTLLVVSNDPLVMSACDRIIYLKDGTIYAQGSFEELIQNQEVIQNL